MSVKWTNKTDQICLACFCLVTVEIELIVPENEKNIQLYFSLKGNSPGFKHEFRFTHHEEYYSASFLLCLWRELSKVRNRVVKWEVQLVPGLFLPILYSHFISIFCKQYPHINNVTILRGLCFRHQF